MSDWDIGPDPGVIAADGRVAVVGPNGWRGTIDADKLNDALKAGFRPESPDEHHDRVLEQQYGDSPISAGLEGAARGATFGLSDTLLRGFGFSKEELGQTKERNATAAGVGEGVGFAGSLALTGGGALAGAVGKAAVKGGTSLLARAGAAGVASGLEGAAFGVGQTVSDVSLSKDPLSAEAIASKLGGNMLYGGLTAGAAGAGLSALGGLARAASVRARNAATRWAEGAAAEAGVPEDLAGLDTAGLKAAHKEELGSLTGAQEGTQLEQRQAVAQNVVAFREEARALGGQLPELAAVGDAAGKGFVREINAAERKLGAVASLPKGIAKTPGKALDALEGYETTLRKLGDVLPEEQAAPIRALADKSKALYGQLEDAAKPLAEPTSDRLTAIADQLERRKNPPVGDQVADALKSQALGAASGYVGHMLAGPFGALGGVIASAGVGMLKKRMAGGAAEFAASITDKLDRAFSVASTAAPAVARNVAIGLSYGVNTARQQDTDQVHGKALDVMNAVANIDVAQRQIHDGLAGVRAADPQLALQLEQLAVDRLKYAKQVAPQDPGLGSPGQPRWQPAASALSKFAGILAVIENPLRALDHLTSDTLTPSIVDALKNTSPQTYAHIQQQVLQRVVQPGYKLTSSRKLGLSMLTGNQIDSQLRPYYIGAQQARYNAMRQEAEQAKPGSPAPSTSFDTRQNLDSTPTRAQQQFGG